MTKQCSRYASRIGPTGMMGALGLLLLLFLAACGPGIWGVDAWHLDVAAARQGPSAQHLLGTDSLGRDMFARVMSGARLSLILAVLATALGSAAGVLLGAFPTVLGHRGRRAWESAMNTAIAFPPLLLALCVATVAGVGAKGAVLALGIATAPNYARLTYTLASSVSGSDYVSAARMLGVSRSRLMLRHVLPNIAEPLIVTTTLQVGGMLIALSGLSFLGLGVQPPSYDWGRLLSENVNRIYTAPAAALGPGVAIVIAGLVFNALGETAAALVRDDAAASARDARPRRFGGARSRTAAGLPQPGAAGQETAVADADAYALRMHDLRIAFPGPAGPVHTVRGVTLDVRRGETVGIVGESGSGKTLTAMAIAGLVPEPGRVTAGRMEIAGRDAGTLRAPERRKLLGSTTAVVFQDPLSSFNPALKMGRQLTEASEVHLGLPHAEAMRLAQNRLNQVRVPSPAIRMAQYPHELSGGMRQRAMIAMGLMGRPELIIADEPTTALDVTVQEQIVRLLGRINEDTGAAVLMISHDISVVTSLCRRVVVMYAGRIVEDVGVGSLLDGPAHPYTEALLAAVPHMGSDRDQPLATIPGRPPQFLELPPGCAFAPRCRFASDKCHGEQPPLEFRDGRRVACWHPRPPLPADRADTTTTEAGPA
ncbi:dipeptide/oligopeptide/nickel ABC transporter permease/ATP-binding protein [Streptomyces sp. 142MFCol3.1]|uniref:dipeptide/oligopeptide/nickel ABC transporter permease/ATP-binding protein n=1 Tax=Streptomyces sp. 142MFCol3.1 TaxID=1172179 RepID=UPI00040C22A7|nr:dipeptide/oligopeptide/nickel ABC transporter permease/ATP-binding protein [Streptomyces sp. 142MFCol3.1]